MRNISQSHTDQPTDVVPVLNPSPWQVFISNRQHIETAVVGFIGNCEFG
jgi:hypothetical protein